MTARSIQPAGLLGATITGTNKTVVARGDRMGPRRTQPTHTEMNATGQRPSRNVGSAHGRKPDAGIQEEPRSRAVPPATPFETSLIAAELPLPTGSRAQALSYADSQWKPPASSLALHDKQA
ncbi:hypothetical protein [Cucumibacter marinus]|uniref:hypothetical protein n=1 Tax=Cucumibacter marinus TaxID=1121252 RepID=UPI0004083C5B|nr:hypothetical protein [Cucumibacter marinus]